LGDLNPNNIERVEVLKGAAAATLYGSDATNGVIQIITKRGRSSDQKTEWNMGLSTGFEELRHNLPTTQFPRFKGPDSTFALDANETMIQKGPYYGVDLSASGGTQHSTYFTSTQISKQTGSIQPNDQLKGSLRLNLSFAPNGKWTIEGRSSYARDRINEIQVKQLDRPARQRPQRRSENRVEITPVWRGMGPGEGHPVHDNDVFKQAVTKFSAGLAAAQAIAGDAPAPAKWVNIAYVGRARANLMAGNYPAANADAQQVAAGFQYDAIFSEGAASTQSTTGQQFHRNRNRSGGLRRAYHSRVHVIDSLGSGEAFLRDWFDATKNDKRMAVTRKAGQLGVNNRFAYFGITKHSDRAAPIRILSKIESTLIEAKVAMRANDYATEASLLNSLRPRAAVGLSAIPVPAPVAAAQTALLNERQAELWVEGSRMQDLARFGLVSSMIGPARATKLPLSRTEILNNGSMKDGGGTCPSVS